LGQSYHSDPEKGTTQNELVTVIYCHLMVINGLTNNGESWNDMGLPFGNLLQFAIENDHRHS